MTQFADNCVEAPTCFLPVLGGAFGAAPGGTHTDGSLTGRPAVPAGASALLVRITFLRGSEEFPYDLKLPRP
ncbi:hypothetical protein [Streptomyces sp. NPDC048473]|uniref:hypothetical protein n=1 Tax=unclassified Streptomyces TaxID=2593676 RepID=UPI003720BFD0